MAEVTGIVLAGIPLILYALDNYKRCLDPTKDYWRYASTLSTIRSHLFVQREQLNVTIANLGLVNPSRSDLEQHLLGLYSSAKCAEFLVVIDNMEQITARMMEKLDIDATGKPRWSSEPQERVHWEWRRVRRSFSRKERDQLIAELQYWNTALRNIFEKAEIPADESDPVLDEIQARFNRKHCDTIRKNIQTVHELLSNRWRCGCQQHQGNIRLDWPVSKVAPADKFMLLVSSNCPHQWHTTVVEFDHEQGVVDDPTLPPTQSPVPRPVSPSRREKWKGFLKLPNNKKNQSVQFLAPPSPGPSTTPDLQEIACLCTHFSDCSYRSSGYIPCTDDRGKRLVLSRASSSDSQKVKCVALQSLLIHHECRQPPRTFLLSRKQRFAIAAAAAWATLYLCGTPWMDKDWQGKEQIELFLETTGSVQSLTQFPTLRYLFKSAHQDSLPETRPSCADPGHFERYQIRNRYLFALGVLLIELCLNKPFEQIREESLGDKSPPPSASSPNSRSSAASDYEIANRQTDYVYLDAGHLYGYAVQRCLRCEFPGQDSRKTFEFHQFRQHFFAGVVAPIQATFMKQPDSIAAI